jgi:hypothetical protein
MVAAAIPAPPAGPPPAVWDPVAAEAEWHRLQAEKAAAAALAANPAVKIEGKRAAEGSNSAAKRVKREVAGYYQNLKVKREGKEGGDP